MSDFERSKSVQDYLHRINRSEQKINFLLNRNYSPKRVHSINIEDTEIKPRKAIKLYIKKRINKEYEELEKALELLVSNKKKSIERSDSDHSPIHTVARKEEKSEKSEKIEFQKEKSPLITDKIKHSRRNITPFSKNKRMKDYYINMVKPISFPRLRKLNILHKD